MVSFFVIKCVQCFSDNIYSKPIIVVESKERSNRIIGEREHTLRIKHIFKNAISGSEQQNWTHSNIVEYHEISDDENDAPNKSKAASIDKMEEGNGSVENMDGKRKSDVVVCTFSRKVVRNVSIFQIHEKHLFSL